MEDPKSKRAKIEKLSLANSEGLIEKRKFLNGRTLTQVAKEDILYNSKKFREKLETDEGAIVMTTIAKNKHGKDVYHPCWLFDNSRVAAKALSRVANGYRTYANFVNPCFPVLPFFDFDAKIKESPEHKQYAIMDIAKAIFHFWIKSLEQLSVPTQGIHLDYFIITRSFDPNKISLHMHYKKDAPFLLVYWNIEHQKRVAAEMQKLIEKEYYSSSSSSSSSSSCVTEGKKEIQDMARILTRKEENGSWRWFFDPSIYNNRQWKTPFSHKPKQWEQIPLDDRTATCSFDNEAKMRNAADLFSAEEKEEYIWQGMPNVCKSILSDPLVRVCRLKGVPEYPNLFSDKKQIPNGWQAASSLPCSGNHASTKDAKAIPEMVIKSGYNTSLSMKESLSSAAIREKIIIPSLRAFDPYSQLKFKGENESQIFYFIMTCKSNGRMCPPCSGSFNCQHPVVHESQNATLKVQKVLTKDEASIGVEFMEYFCFRSKQKLWIPKVGV